jgi:formate hydrogenlyase subunit 3/multisubunit Na+/H+ antiporter MnhD subunit
VLLLFGLTAALWPLVAWLAGRDEAAGTSAGGLLSDQ